MRLLAARDEMSHSVLNMSWVRVYIGEMKAAGLVMRMEAIVSRMLGLGNRGHGGGG
jgi:hypothetical protein